MSFKRLFLAVICPFSPRIRRMRLFCTYLWRIGANELGHLSIQGEKGDDIDGAFMGSDDHLLRSSREGKACAWL